MILLTSPSSRRKELLRQIGFLPGRDFLQIDVRQDINFHRDSPTLTLEEAQEKIFDATKEKVIQAIVNRNALAALKLEPSKTVVIGATTAIYFVRDQKVLGRPLLPDVEKARHIRTDNASLHLAEAEARKMLNDLSGQNFKILTAVVATRGDCPEQLRWKVVISEAKMREFTPEEVESYIKTGEPLDKAGGFGIQERGVVLFEEILGSYSNIVGLPLYEFNELLHDPLFNGCVQFHISEKNLPESRPQSPGLPELKVVSMGDINYDLSFNTFQEGFFANLAAPGIHIEQQLRRSIGGTGVNFALRARDAGFKFCSVLGVIAHDELGKYIEQELYEQGIETLLPMSYKKGRRTSIALMLRENTQRDLLITLTHADQALTEEEVSKAKSAIEASAIYHVSGYCLTDPSRREATLRTLDWASAANPRVVLDVTVDMNHAMNFEEFLRMTEGKVKVLVSEIPTMLAWLDEAHHDQREWGELRNVFMQRLAPHFPVVFLRTSDYSHEIIITPNGYKGPNRLDYADLAPEKKIGYGDRLTAEHLHDFLSPRILLASESPRRLALLQQILPRNKVQVAVSGLAEDQVENENPIDRVTRLAQEKALKTWEDFRKLPENSDKHNIQIVIGADTEIVLDGKTVMHPTSDRQAKEILSSLSGKEVTAITGYCLLHTRTYTETNTDEVITSHAETQLKIKELTTAEIDQYVQSGEPIGKAGAFGIQGKGALLIERIKGSYSNVVGLPLEQLAKELNDIGTSIWVLDEVSNWTFPTKGKK